MCGGGFDFRECRLDDDICPKARRYHPYYCDGYLHRY
jgi:hypothetical protein